MATTPTNSFSLAWLLRAKGMRSGGFTLTELLIAIVVGSIIVTTMLYLVVELLQINRREEVLTQTQQDMRRAIDYISRDAGEAIYIYSSPNQIVNTETGATLLDQLDDFPKAGQVPVLAFWRLDPLDPSNPKVKALFDKDCSSFTTVAERAECNTLKIRQGSYTLVVYAQQPNTGNDIWGGKSRIVRYELPKYVSGKIDNLEKTPGYSEPTGVFTDGPLAGRPKRFDLWAKGTGDTKGNFVVLTDFVDESRANVTSDCRAGYTKTPADANNFYVCVQQGTSQLNEDDARLTTGSNQTLIVFLRGNASTENSGFATFSDTGRLPTLESEVLIRGVLDKRPGL